MGFPSGAGKESACPKQETQRCRFDPWVEKIPWRWEWKATPVFSPREVHVQRSLVGCSSWSLKQLDTTEQLSLHVHTELAASDQSPLIELPFQCCGWGKK